MYKHTFFPSPEEQASSFLLAKNPVQPPRASQASSIEFGSHFQFLKYYYGQFNRMVIFDVWPCNKATTHPPPSCPLRPPPPPHTKK